MKAQVAIITLLIAGTVMAQNEQGNRPPPRGEGGFIKHFDQDGDGQVALDEFKGPDEHFTKLDQDGDGFITPEEAPKGLPPKRGKDDQQGAPECSQEGGRPGEGGFINRFDQDSDGRVSQDEFDGPDEHFEHMDKNGDGYISEDETPKGPPPGKGDKNQVPLQEGGQP